MSQDHQDWLANKCSMQNSDPLTQLFTMFKRKASSGEWYVAQKSYRWMFLLEDCRPSFIVWLKLSFQGNCVLNYCVVCHTCSPHVPSASNRSVLIVRAVVWTLLKWGMNNPKATAMCFIAFYLFHWFLDAALTSLCIQPILMSSTRLVIILWYICD